MEYIFRLSEMSGRLSVSPIVEIGAAIAESGALSFAYGAPANELYPIKALEEAFKSVFADPSKLGYYDYEAGIIELREWIASWTTQDGVCPPWVSAQNVIITTGGLEAIAFAAESLLQEGRTVLVEDPTYAEALMAFRKTGADIVGVPCDADGIIPAALENILRSREDIGFLYTIPNYQNPSGALTPLHRRKEIAAITGKYGLPIVEDDPYRYISYGDISECVPSYMSLCGDEKRVVYIGSFSKLIAPALRTGFIIAPSALLPPLIGLRTIAGVTTPTVVQEGIYNFLSGSDFNAHIKHLCAVYKERRDAMTQLLSEQITPLGVTSNVPGGGFFIWCKMREGENGDALAISAIKNHKIGIMPGSYFSLSGQKNTFRLSFSKVTQSICAEGMPRLRAAIEEFRQGIYK